MKTILTVGGALMFGVLVFLSARGEDLTPYRCTTGVAIITSGEGHSEWAVMYLRKVGIPCSGTTHSEILSGMLYVPAKQAVRARNVLRNLAKAHAELGIEVEDNGAIANIPCG